MFLRLLVPLTVVWPVLAVFAEGTSLRRYKGTWARELLALLFCLVLFFVIWLALHGLLGSFLPAALAVVFATLISLIALYPTLWLGFKVFGVRPSAETGAH